MEVAAHGAGGGDGPDAPVRLRPPPGNGRQGNELEAVESYGDGLLGDFQHDVAVEIGAQPLHAPIVEARAVVQELDRLHELFVGWIRIVAVRRARPKDEREPALERPVEWRRRRLVRCCILADACARRCGGLSSRASPSPRKLAKEEMDAVSATGHVGPRRTAGWAKRVARR